MVNLGTMQITFFIRPYKEPCKYEFRKDGRKDCYHSMKYHFNMSKYNKFEKLVKQDVTADQHKALNNLQISSTLPLPVKLAYTERG